MRLPADRPGSFATLVELLRDGGVAIVPCDTMYGFVGTAPATEPVLRRIKGRGDDKPFLLLVAESSWLDRVSPARVPPRLARYWPGPLTLVVPALEGGTVAVRVPDAPFLARLIRAVGSPLYSTSVNRAGMPPLESVDAMAAEFGSEVAAVWDAGDMPAGPGSTIVDVTGRPFRILRQGALTIPAEDLV